MAIAEPYGYCQCGCGEKTKLHPKSWARMGWVAGEPRLWLPGHSSRREEMREMARKIIPAAQAVRHAKMKTNRLKRHVKAGTAQMAKAFLRRTFTFSAKSL